MIYIKAINTGKGFYTHEDRKNMPTFKRFGDIFMVEGNYADWVKRVNGSVITETEAKKIMEKVFNAGKIKKVSILTGDLSKAKNKVFENDYQRIKIR